MNELNGPQLKAKYNNIDSKKLGRHFAAELQTLCLACLQLQGHLQVTR